METMPSHEAVATDAKIKRDFVPSTAAYWEKRLAEHWGIEGVGNIGLGIAYNRWQYRQRESIFRRYIASLPGHLREASILDVGSGIGFWLTVWNSLEVKSLTGVDITSIAVQNLRLAHPQVRVIQLDISSPSAGEVLDAQYDFISAMDVLSHITSDVAFSSALENISKALKPGGYFVFSENLPHKERNRNFNSIQANRTIGMFTQALACHQMRIVVRAPIFVLMMTPLDTSSEAPRKLWRLLMEPLRHFPFLGHLYGPVLFSIDQLLTRIFREGPSTELVICKKV
jgi:2-polyprenyl-3-methyl-5-hydroxy-6-metoxy-1,4-benzoquinol methylase